MGGPVDRARAGAHSTIHERQLKWGGGTQPNRTRELHEEEQGRVQRTRKPGGQRGRGGNKDSGGIREPKRGGGESVRIGGSDNTGSLPGARANPAQPASGGGASHSPTRLSARQDWGLLGACQEGGDGRWNRQPKPTPATATLSWVPKTLVPPPPPVPLLDARALRAATPFSKTAKRIGLAQISGRRTHRDVWVFSGLEHA